MDYSARAQQAANETQGPRTLSPPVENVRACLNQAHVALGQCHGVLNIVESALGRGDDKQTVSPDTAPVDTAAPLMPVAHAAMDLRSGLSALRERLERLRVNLGG